MFYLTWNSDSGGDVLPPSGLFFVRVQHRRQLSFCLVYGTVRFLSITLFNFSYKTSYFLCHSFSFWFLDKSTRADIENLCEMLMLCSMGREKMFPTQVSLVYYFTVGSDFSLVSITKYYSRFYVSPYIEIVRTPCATHRPTLKPYQWEII